MKKNDVQIGATYLVKVAGNLVPVKIDREHDNGGWVGTSVKTGKTIRIKSPQRLRKRLADAAPTGKRIMTKAQYEAEAGAAGTSGKKSSGGITEANKADAVNAAMLAVEADKKKRAKKAPKATQDAKSATKRDTGERGATGGEPDGKPMSLLDAAAHILSLGAALPMRCKDIVDLAVARTRLLREWHGERYEVVVEADGFRYEGKIYRSAARAITGSHISGNLFFGLRRGCKGKGGKR
ncbi:MAG: DUF2924 domain-containing protein [Acidobacteria bacterium]|nr:DUF2924 domain-containing protein [Acidobacteriota bacterium]